MAEQQAQDKARYIRCMFDRIARRYDLMNTVMTAGMHHRWRSLATHLVLQDQGGKLTRGTIALDVATGTGDFALELARQGVGQVVGLDFLPRMLRLATRKTHRRNLSNRVTLVLGDALHLPFPPDTFQWVTSGFNMRNVEDLEGALAEMIRVARPGGCVGIVEIMPFPKANLFYRLYRWYFSTVTPLLGQMLAGDRTAYGYLPASVERFLTAPDFARVMEQKGLDQVRYRRVGLGTVAIHIGIKPRKMFPNIR